MLRTGSHLKDGLLSETDQLISISFFMLLEGFHVWLVSLHTYQVIQFVGIVLDVHDWLLEDTKTSM